MAVRYQDTKSSVNVKNVSSIPVGSNFGGYTGGKSSIPVLGENGLTTIPVLDDGTKKPSSGGGGTNWQAVNANKVGGARALGDQVKAMDQAAQYQLDAANANNDLLRQQLDWANRAAETNLAEQNRVADIQWLQGQ